ncbi:MAG: leucyl-tRNA synthetase [Lasallia pustulata]|uniref:leucine--tRNA ligase n=1 Tax=Lasallia pustulata TaxID=136370 RepID=A0A5M8PX23_9LECA|nr:MAG: leucyl-tRNA synthetase [Lasallia pustulata]
MDTFVDSSWYFMRFADAHNVTAPFAPSAAEAFLPVDIYVGGVEHAILRLLYARFLSKFIPTTTLWPSGGGPRNNGEPFQKPPSQGMVHGKKYSDPDSGRFLKPEEVDLTDSARPRIAKTGEPPTISWEKMSKSKHNGVDPTICIQKYSADATRAHILFQAPVTEVLEWDESRIIGIQRWLSRIWRLVAAAQPPHNPTTPLCTLTAESHLWTLTHRTISSATIALTSSFSLNTLISSLMHLTNELSAAPPSATNPALLYHATSALLRMLAPVAPAVAEECWERLHAETGGKGKGGVGCVLDEASPVADAALERGQRGGPADLRRAGGPAVSIRGQIGVRDAQPLVALSADGGDGGQEEEMRVGWWRGRRGSARGWKT